MKKHNLTASLLALPLLVAACTGTAGVSGTGSSGTASSPSVGGTRTSEGGQVTVVATWNGPATGATFEVKLDTHSADLDSLDLSNTVLRNDRGEILAARPWAAAKGGHHREGSLTFDGDAANFLAGAKWIEMTVSGVGDIPERTLRWEIGS
jgi:hypothetical protein